MLVNDELERQSALGAHHQSDLLILFHHQRIHAGVVLHHQLLIVARLAVLRDYCTLLAFEGG